MGMLPQGHRVLPLPEAMCLSSSGPSSRPALSGGLSPRPVLRHPHVSTVLVVTLSFLSGPRDAKCLFLEHSVPPCAPPTNKSTVLQSHRKPGLSLCWVTLGKFLSIQGPKLPCQQNGTVGNSAFLLGGCDRMTQGQQGSLTW